MYCVRYGTWYCSPRRREPKELLTLGYVRQRELAHVEEAQLWPSEEAEEVGTEIIVLPIGPGRSCDDDVTQAQCKGTIVFKIPP